MADPVTLYINRTESLVIFALEKLSASTHWTAYKLPGMLPESLMERIPGMKLPSVAVTHSSSEYGNLPRRTANISVIVSVDASDENSEFTARDLADEVISLLDGQISENALYRISTYSALDCDPSLTSHLLVFRVEDH